jgi:hypothetical protein
MRSGIDCIGDGQDEIEAMHRDLASLSLLRQVYLEAPQDVFELIVYRHFQLNERERGRGSLNAFRLANKRFKQVVESCTTRLTSPKGDGPDSLPVSIIERCRGVQVILCFSHNLSSLEGCPDRLKKLWIARAPHLSDLSPLASCSMMQDLRIQNSSITELSVVASMPLLEVLDCQREEGLASIKDLSPLSFCPRLYRLNARGSEGLKDLSPLSACTALEVLEFTNCHCITSLAPLLDLSKLKVLRCRDCPLVTDLSPLSSLTNLHELYFGYCPITSLFPLSNLKNLQKLDCRFIDPQTSLLPLASCTGLKELECDEEAVDLEELRNRMPQLKILAY